MLPLKVLVLSFLASTALAADCDAIKDEQTCHDTLDSSNQGCLWCKSAAVPSSCHNVTMSANLPPSIFECEGEANLESDAYYLVLALQKCQGSSDWTLHGLWPEWGQNCGSEEFDESQISSIEGDMEKYWLSCPEYSDTNLEFWDHEWSKHGTCTSDVQKTFFSDGLAARSKFLSKCDSASGTSCEMCLTASSKSSTDLTYYGTSCP